MTFAPSLGTLQPLGREALSGPRPASIGRYSLAFRDFLRAEEDATGRLMLFYKQARLEIGDYMQSLLGQVPQVDLDHYRELQAGIDVMLGELDAGGAKWADDSIANAYAAGKGLSGTPDFTTLHDEAVRALSRGTLDLITATSADVRRGIQQEIAQAVIGTIGGPELIARLMGTGLTSGPWKSLEERAGVIARTETMRAFNSGNMAGITESGARLVEWITSEDEAVCRICGPRDGEVYRLDGAPAPRVKPAGKQARCPARFGRQLRCEKPAGHLGDHSHGLPELGGVTWPNKTPGIGAGIETTGFSKEDVAWLAARPALSSIGGHPPAHPRCRCTVSARFRGPSGNVLGDPGDVGDRAAAAEAAATKRGVKEAIAGERPSRTFDGEFDRLVTGSWRNDPEALAFWRQHGALTPAQLKRIADGDMLGFSEFMQARYGVRTFEFGGKIVRGQHRMTVGRSPQFTLLAKNAELRRLTLESFEEFHRLGVGRYVNALEEGMDGNIYLRTFAPAGQGSNVLASCSSDGWIMWDTKKALKFIADGTLRAGPDVNGVKEMLIHEIGHSIHNRFGASGAMWRATEAAAETAAGREEWHGAWAAIRRATGKYIAGWKETGKGGPASAGQLTDALEANLKMKIEELAGLDRIALDTEYARTRYDDFLRVLTNAYGEERGKKYALPFDDWRANEIRRADRYHIEIPELQTKIATAKSAASEASKPIESFGEHWSTEYGKTSAQEDFAESVALYLLNPDRLRRYSPLRYAFMRDRVFDGVTR